MGNLRERRRAVHFRRQGRESVREGRDKALLLLAILEIKERVGWVYFFFWRRRQTRVFGFSFGFWEKNTKVLCREKEKELRFIVKKK